MFRSFSFLLFICYFQTPSFAQPAGTWKGHNEYLVDDSSGSKETRLKLNRSYTIQIDAEGRVNGTSRIYYTHSKSSTPMNIQESFVGRYNAVTGKIAIVFKGIKLVESPLSKREDSAYYSCSLTQIGDSLAMTLLADNKQAVDFKYFGNTSWQISPLPPLMHVRYTKPVELPALKIKEPDAVPARDREIQHTIILDTSFIRIDLYDNGEIDHDTVTLQLDGKTIVRSQRLSLKPVSLWLELRKEPAEHLLEMFADNLGSIPPNTALLVLTCKKNRYELNLSSNEKVNGSVKLIVRPGL